MTGSAALVAPTTAGSTNSARTISAHLLTYSEQPSSVVTLERRYGPRRLRDDDDDDNRREHFGLYLKYSKSDSVMELRNHEQMHRQTHMRRPEHAQSLPANCNRGG